MKSMVNNVFQIFCFFLLLGAAHVALADEKKEQLLKDVKSEILNRIAIKDINQPDVWNPDFVDYYNKEIVPNIDRLYSGTRVMAVKIKDDGKLEEAILIGDTARESAWGLRNYIAVAVKEKGQWRIKAFEYVDNASYHCNDHKACEFSYYRIHFNPKTPNSSIGAFLSFAYYGASGHRFFISTIGWSAVENKYYISMQDSLVPLIPDGQWIE